MSHSRLVLFDIVVIAIATGCQIDIDSRAFEIHLRLKVSCCCFDLLLCRSILNHSRTPHVPLLVRSKTLPSRALTLVEPHEASPNDLSVFAELYKFFSADES